MRNWPVVAVGVAALFVGTGLAHARAVPSRSGGPGGGSRAGFLAKRKADEIRGMLVQAKAKAQAAAADGSLATFNQAKTKFGQACSKLNTMKDSGAMSKAPETAKVEAECAATLQEMYALAEPMLLTELAETKLPDEVYTANDKETFRDMITAAWQKEYPKDKILAVLFPSDEWKNRKVKRWNDAVKKWQYTDTSSLRLSVVVQQTDKIATIYPAYINKRKLEGTTNAGVATKYGKHATTEIPVANLPE